MNLVKLSELLEVSRSAITQSVRRLTKKNLVTFEFAQDNEKNKLFFSQVDIKKEKMC
jgi:DNA-binding MarR family transcriptional regulator